VSLRKVNMKEIMAMGRGFGNHVNFRHRPYQHQFYGRYPVMEDIMEGIL
jgi:hypothetical protein